MIDVTLKNFESQVITASMQTPILVDFWAPWCGPCKSLSPVLEKLEKEYKGRFILVKINSDNEQQIAAAFGIRSIPTCILIKQGQPVDGFQGAVPEGQVRLFLDKHIPSESELQAQAGQDQAQELLDAGDTQAACDHLQSALEADPENDEARAALVRVLIGMEQFKQARKVLEPGLKRVPTALRFTALAAWIDAIEFVQTDPRGQWTLAQFDTLIAQNKRDFPTRFDKARVLMSEAQWTRALDELLEIIMRDKKWNDEAARKLYVAILDILTPPPEKPAAAATAGKTGIELTGKIVSELDPRLELVDSYRRKLSMALN